VRLRGRALLKFERKGNRLLRWISILGERMAGEELTRLQTAPIAARPLANGSIRGRRCAHSKPTPYRVRLAERPKTGSTSNMKRRTLNVKSQNLTFVKIDFFSNKALVF